MLLARGRGPHRKGRRLRPTVRRRPLLVTTWRGLSLKAASEARKQSLESTCGAVTVLHRDGVGTSNCQQAEDGSGIVRTPSSLNSALLRLTAHDRVPQHDVAACDNVTQSTARQALVQLQHPSIYHLYPCRQSATVSRNDEAYTQNEERHAGAHCGGPRSQKRSRGAA